MQNNNKPQDIETSTLTSPAGMQATIVNLGATLATLTVPAASGSQDVVLAYADPADYVTDRYFLGTTVGPFANRIRDARFRLDNEEYVLEANESNTGHCLHSGSTGLHRQYFDLQESADGKRVECHCSLPDGLGGFPGNRSVSVVYEVAGDAALAIDFAVTSDRDTVVSLANHAYFNLGGALAEHRIRIEADAYTPVHPSNIPTGEIRAVAGTEFDLRDWGAIGDRQFDHNFVLHDSDNKLRLAAELRSPASGLRLRVLTTQPGLQFYTADYLADPFAPRAGLCLEAQAFPDTPNQPRFPTARLAAGATWRQRTVYEFATVSD